jgi:hypothetical protein
MHGGGFLRSASRRGFAGPYSVFGRLAGHVFALKRAVMALFLGQLVPPELLVLRLAAASACDRGITRRGAWTSNILRKRRRPFGRTGSASWRGTLEAARLVYAIDIYLGGSTVCVVEPFGSILKSR